MRIRLFLKDKTIFIVFCFLIALFSAFLLYMVDAKLFFMLFIPTVYFSGCIFVLVMEFIRKNAYYKKLLLTLEDLDQKFLLSEIIGEPDFYEGQILYDILKTTSKSMNDEIATHRLSTTEYREYIELWVHEIKTPIAGAKLIGDNMGNDNLLSAIQRIDQYVEQALFYSRSNAVEKYFLIKQVELKELVNSVLRKNTKYLIERKIRMDVTDIFGTVFTDTKWIEFILWQLLDNAIKYKAKEVKIYSKKNSNRLSLLICDNGIGIAKQDIGRVFDKGFTGESGRIHTKATGLGLYLCKKLCFKLGLNISLQSEQGKGTSVELIFPKSEMHSIF